jgi:hypothetical protein
LATSQKGKEPKGQVADLASSQKGYVISNTNQSNTDIKVIKKESKIYGVCDLDSDLEISLFSETDSNLSVVELCEEASGLENVDTKEEKKEKISPKRKKLEVDNEFKNGIIKHIDLGKEILKNQQIPESDIDKARLILFIHNTIRDKHKIRNEETFINKVLKQLKKKVDYKEIIECIWILEHNKFTS